MNKNKLTIIFIILFFSFVIGGGCYCFFLAIKKNNEVISEHVYEIARNDVSAFCMKLADYEQKVIDKKTNNENCNKSVKILQDQGIWDGLSEPYFKKYSDTAQSLALTTFKPQIDKLLEKVEKEKNLENFYEELKKIGTEMKKESLKNIEVLVELAERAQEEAKKPMPFFATWTGLIFSAIICLIVLIVFLWLKKCDFENRKLLTVGLLLFFFLFSYLLIFPLINCLLLLKMSSFKETYKHYYYNKFKRFFLFANPIVSMLIFFFIVFLQSRCQKNKGEEKNTQ